MTQFSIDAIFFDVDGTLVNSFTDIARSVNHMLCELGREPLPEKTITGFIGTGTRDLVKRCLGAAPGELVDKGLAIFSGYYPQHAHDTSVLYPHTKEVLEYFKDKRKFIVTNRFARFAESTLDGFGVLGYFEGIVGGDNEECLKPSGCIIENILGKYNLARERSMMVGDMALDVLTGKNAGTKTCWVSYGLGRRDEVLPLRPDMAVDDLLDLTKMVAR